MVKAVLFGSLSTLTNLVDLERRAFNQTFEQHRVAISWNGLEYMTLLRKKGRFSGPANEVEAITELDKPSFYADLEENFRDLIDGTSLEPHSWTRAALKHLSIAGTKVALVSGAERQTVLRVLAAVFQHSASRVFDVVTAQGDTPEPKPSPALYEKALSKLGVYPANAIAIEATHHGMRAAQAAGIWTAGFSSRFSSAEQLSLADADLGEDYRATVDLFRASQLEKSATIA